MSSHLTLQSSGQLKLVSGCEIVASVPWFTINYRESHFSAAIVPVTGKEITEFFVAFVITDPLDNFFSATDKMVIIISMSLFAATL